MAHISNTDNSYTLWQEAEGEGYIPEPAIVINTYSDCYSIQQENNDVVLNYTSIDELIVVLKKIKKEHLQRKEKGK